MKMKMKFVFFLFAALIGTAAHAATILPDACGSDKIKFDVTTQKTTDKPVPPAEGKAQIIFIETAVLPLTLFGHSSFTTRFGVDGAWVGAAHNNSYFSVDIAPGEHHLCGIVDKFGGGMQFGKQNMIQLASFTAEAGKVYYYEFKIQERVTGHSSMDGSIFFTKLEEDDGKFRVKASEVSTFVPKK